MSSKELILKLQSYSPALKVKVVLLIFYSVGGVVAFTPLNQLLLPFTPVLLTASFIVLFSFEENRSQPFYYWLIFTYLVSFFVEWHGTTYGLLFGEYVYLNNLGPKVFDVPLVIPINWIILAIAGFNIGSSFKGKLPLLPIALICSVIVVMLDVLIEIVCEPLGFWVWDDGMPPFKNYFTWWFFMSIFIYLKLKYIPNRNNLSIFLFILILGYFFLQVIAHNL
ncbi:carotenoid biosynthesis protein [Flammeovirga yaeyamensis]|uniref:Carotenoid biosynthesis protein n=1 Tax=Flammeovirga yaeyamensis TaxID=367791 RepID=A0AAX1N841_9BACT|nr:carotenoid biosynthesis protein [Flammeovirga yaeyamensis]MBB3698971.1 putative membrane protein [Flammeovirga yaeyamensis]NMF36405.1 carotenoid biosynthesis protein [Flammeovirga yaeyamensis]QWG03634.1 carotenoid biosynthesis protein [Flammeovirga yaeyamensis]